MSDDTSDAALGAIHDSHTGAGGANVIDTSHGHVEPDNRGPNPSDERHAHIDETRAKDDAQNRELGAIWDRKNKEDLAEEAARVRVYGDNTHELVEDSHDVSQMPAAEKKQLGLGQTAFEAEVTALVKGLGIDEKDARQAVLNRVMSAKAEAGRPDANALSPELRQLLPRAQNQREAAEQLRPYYEFEQDYRQRGPQAVIDAMAQRGVHLADLSNPQHTAHIAAAYYGVPLHEVATQAGYVPREWHEEQMMMADAQSQIDRAAASRADFNELRPAMAQIIQSGRADTVERAYDIARRERQRSGPGKDKLDRELEATHDRIVGRAVGA